MYCIWRSTFSFHHALTHSFVHAFRHQQLSLINKPASRPFSTPPTTPVKPPNPTDPESQVRGKSGTAECLECRSAPAGSPIDSIATGIINWSDSRPSQKAGERKIHHKVGGLAERTSYFPSLPSNVRDTSHILFDPIYPLPIRSIPCHTITPLPLPFPSPTTPRPLGSCSRIGSPT